MEELMKMWGTYFKAIENGEMDYNEAMIHIQESIDKCIDEDPDKYAELIDSICTVEFKDENGKPIMEEHCTAFIAVMLICSIRLINNYSLDDESETEE